MLDDYTEAEQAFIHLFMHEELPKKPQVIKELETIKDSPNFSRVLSHSLFCATKRGHLELTKWLHGQGADLEWVMKDHDGISVIHIAGSCRDIPTMEWLILMGLNIDSPTDSGKRALHFATQKGDANMARFLLENGADIDKPTNDGISPLMTTAMENRPHTANLLLHEGADPYLSDKNGYTPFLMACKEGSVRTMDEFIANGVDIESPVEINDDGEPLSIPPIVIAAKEKRPQAVMRLLKEEVDAGPTDSEGHSALLYAVLNNDHRSVQALLEADPPVPYEQIDNALEEGIKCGANQSICDLLVDQQSHF